MADLSSFINIGANTASFVGDVNTATDISATGNIVAGYLYGDGSNITGVTATANTGNIAFTDTTIYAAANVATQVVNINYSPEGWAFLQVPSDATANTANTRLVNDAGNVTIETGDFSTGNTSYTWLFGTNGVLQFPRDATGNTDPYLTIEGGSNPGITATDTSLSGPANLQIQSNYLNLSGYTGTRVSIHPDGGNIDADANLVLTSNAAGGSTNSWIFDTTGNLTLPNGNILSAANVGFLYGSKITEVPSPVPGNYALSLSGSGLSDPDQQLLVYPTFVDANHLHLTSGNLYNTELFLGNDDLYVKLANTGNVVINSNDNIGNLAQFTFDAKGNLTIANSINFGGNASLYSYAPNQFTLSANIVDDLTSLNLNSADNNAYLYAGNNVVISSNAVGGMHDWTFSNTGYTTMPGDVTIGTGNTGVLLQSNTNGYGLDASISNITNGNPTVVVTLFDTEFPGPVSGTVRITGVGGETEANGFWGWQAVDVDQIQLYTDATLSTPVDGTAWNAYTGGGTAIASGYNNLDITGGTVSIQSGAGKYWSFNPEGTFVPPTLRVDLHNGGNQNAQTLQFGGDQQVVITGPTPTGGSNAQRLIIQGQRGLGTGEGGDVYVWGGDSDGTNGGDIKIYAGDADGVGGTGGYVNIDGGAGSTQGGPVEITGGSSSGIGGHVNLAGGGGNTGANIGITAGYGSAGAGGSINIQAGGSANGLAEYGNVGISAGASSWAFDNTGTLTFPSLANISGGNFNAGTASATVALTAFSPDGNTVSFQAQGNTSNAVIQAYNNTTTTTQSWTFENTGNLVVPGPITQNNYDSANLIVATVDDQNWAYGFTTNGSTDFYSQIKFFGDSSNTRGAKILDSNSGNSWTFDGTGSLTLPEGTPTIQTPDQTGTITLKVQGGATERSEFQIGSDGGADQFVYISSMNDTGNRVSLDMGAYAGAPAYAKIQTYDGVSTQNEWLFTTAALDPTEAYLYVPGGAAITTLNATGGGVGKNIFIEAGAADQSDFYTTAGGELFLKGGRGAFNDGGGGGPGGDVNINAGESADPAGVAGNVYITAGALQQWVFDNTGNLTIPNSILAQGPVASPAPAISGFQFVGELSGAVSTTGNVFAGVVSASGNIRGGNINTAGIVSASGIVTGNITSTPTYGQFYSNVTQTSTANTVTSMTLNNTDISNGVSVAANSQITISKAGSYNIQFSAQLAKSSGGTANTYIWLAKNGVAIPDSATDVTLIGNGARQVAAWNWLVSATAGDYYEIVWYQTDSVTIDAVAAASPIPGIPSLIVTVVPVGT